jgi:o-succinylbenzoate synthase
MNEPTVHLHREIRATVRRTELAEVRLFHRKFRLHHPLRTSTETMEHREVIQLAIDVIVDGHERTGWGEAAPLEWWGSEKLNHARYDLVRLRDATRVGQVVDGTKAMAMMRPATARFAVESALLDAAAQAAGLPLRRLFAPHPPNVVPVNATIGLVTPDAAFDAAARANDAGFRTIKVKVGGDDDLARVDAVRRAAKGATLRLDANGAWTKEDALNQIERLADDDVEYVEQPVPADALDALAHVTQHASVPIAADESCLPLQRAKQIVTRRCADVLVLKPSLLGAWSDVTKVVEHAVKADIKTVFTSAIDSAINRAVVAQFATLLPTLVTCGLATGSWLEEEGDEEEILREGRLHLGSGNGIGFRPVPRGMQL